MQIIKGSIIKQYASLWDYCEELINSNPGSIVKMKCKTTDDGVTNLRDCMFAWMVARKIFLVAASQLLELIVALSRVFTRDSFWPLWALIQTMQFIQ